MEPIEYVAVCYFEKNLGSHGEVWERVYKIRDNETVAGLMARMPPETARVEIREVQP